MTDRFRLAGRWDEVALALAVLAALTAIVTVRVSGSLAAAFGAVAVGVGFGSVGLFGADALEDAWTEHRRYVGFSTGLFAIGALGGVALYLAGYDLLDLFIEMLGEEFPIDESEAGAGLELDARLFILQNTPPFLASIVGAITLGAVTALVMLFNGVLIGNIALAVGVELGLGLTLALLVPHGIFELPALFLAAGVGFRLLHRFAQRVRGTREAFLTKSYLVRTAVFVGFGWLLLVLAAFVEAYVTVAIAELVFGDF